MIDRRVVIAFVFGATLVGALWLFCGRQQLYRNSQRETATVDLGPGSEYWKSCSYILVSQLRGDDIIAAIPLQSRPEEPRLPSGATVLITEADVSGGATLHGDFGGFGTRVVHDDSDNKDLAVDLLKRFGDYGAALGQMKALGCFD